MTRRDADDPDQNAEADLELVRAALERRPGAIDLLVDRLGCVRRILGALNVEMARPLNDHDIEDLTQDTLLKILDKIDDFEGRARLETWVYRFCYLELMNRIRRESRRAVVPIEVEPEVSMEPGYDVAAEVGRIERLIEELGPPRSHVIRLRHFEELPFLDIARILKIPANTARTHYHRGLALLRERVRTERERESK